MKAIQILLVMLVFVFVQAQAQTLTPELVSSGGNFVSGGGYSLSQTIGELSVQTVGSGSSILTQGFQQPYPETFVGIRDPENSGINLTVFPNPAGNYVYVTLRSENDVSYNLRISDVTGKEFSVSQQTSSSFDSTITLDLNMLSTGFYFLTISFADNNFRQTIPIYKY